MIMASSRPSCSSSSSGSPSITAAAASSAGKSDSPRRMFQGSGISVEILKYPNHIVDRYGSVAQPHTADSGESLSSFGSRGRHGSIIRLSTPQKEILYAFDAPGPLALGSA